MTTAILDIRPPARTGKASPDRSASDLVRLLALDRPLVRSLACRWHRDGDGRLVCLWEPDVAPAPHP